MMQFCSIGIPSFSSSIPPCYYSSIVLQQQWQVQHSATHVLSSIVGIDKGRKYNASIVKMKLTHRHVILPKKLSLKYFCIQNVLHGILNVHKDSAKGRKGDIGLQTCFIKDYGVSAVPLNGFNLYLVKC